MPEQHLAEGESERETLIHELRVHQVELETQNEQLRETQHLLEESRARYADLYEFAPVAYCSLDTGGCIVEINLTGATLLGRERAALHGRPFSVFVAYAERPRFRAHLEQCYKTREKVTVELTLAPTHLPTLPVEAVLVAFEGHDGCVTCRVALSDISERRRAEEEQRLSVRMREDFLAIVSHDLRNPLNSIVMGAELLLAATPVNDRRKRGRRQLETIKRAAGRMSRLLADLLDLSSMSSGHLSMLQASEDIDAIVAIVLDIVGPQAGEKKQRVLYRPSAALLAYCDRDRIVQVLLNLVGNAMKFAPQESDIVIEVSRAGNEAMVAVRDSGCGIDEAQLAHIFEPYWQAEKTAKKGTGLGLSIAKGIVEYHGGKLWVESAPEKGSTFYFTLPLAHADRDEPRATVGGEAQRRLLIVDDEDDTRHMLADVLESHGFHIATATNGRDALSYLRRCAEKPSLILLDLVMPVMDGWQFLAERAADPQLAAIPVMLISGQVTAHKTAESLGLVGYIGKPIGVANLFQALQRHMS